MEAYKSRRKGSEKGINQFGSDGKGEGGKEYQVSMCVGCGCLKGSMGGKEQCREEVRKDMNNFEGKSGGRASELRLSEGKTGGKRP